MTANAKRRQERAGYKTAPRCGNCEHLSVSPNVSTLTCMKLAAPVRRDKVCVYHKPNETNEPSNP